MINLTKQKGFTLIELLVVIAIISLLASIVIVSLDNAQAKARDAKRISDMRQIATALELYRIDHGEYPGFGDFYGFYSSIAEDYEFMGDDWTDLENILEKYIDNLPVDPINDEVYQYFYIPTGYVSPDANQSGALLFKTENTVLNFKTVEEGDHYVFGFYPE